MNALDIFGDIHGHVDKLAALLRTLGYAEVRGAWRHPERQVAFVGDFIDRGPEQVATYRLVRAMVEAGSALAVMGNHEFNAIAFHSSDGAGGHLRARSDKKRRQHAAFLAQVGEDTPLHAEIVDWFAQLPLWLDLPGCRIVHACWHEPSMHALAPLLGPGNRLTPAATAAAAQRGSAEYRAVETLLKGVELPLPDGWAFLDKDGMSRSDVRVRWWDQAATRYDEAAMPLPGGVTIPALPLAPEVLCGYDRAKPLFLGHYWLTGKPALLTDRIACVDYSAGAHGPLVAYRWDGEQVLDPARFVAVGGDGTVPRG